MKNILLSCFLLLSNSIVLLAQLNPISFKGLPTDYTVSQASKFGVIDFDDDGDKDLVTYDSGLKKFVWLNNNANVYFNKQIIFPINDSTSEYSQPNSLLIADFDNDGGKDILFDGGNSGIYLLTDEGNLIYKNNLIGNFSATALNIGDVDQNGTIDFVAINKANGELVWYSNDANGSYSISFIDTGLDEIYSPTIVDVDQNGTNDIVLCAEGSNEILWYSNDGAQNFSQKSIDTFNPYVVKPCDFDNDGDIDFVISVRNNTVKYLKNDGNENFTLGFLYSSTNISSIEVGDINGDGFLDVFSRGKLGNEMVWLKNSGDSENISVTPIIIRSNIGFTLDFAIIEDINGDGLMDIIGSRRNNDGILWWGNNGDDSFNENIIANNIPDIVDVVTIDIDSDGSKEILVSSLYDPMTCFNNLGNHQFSQSIINDELSGFTAMQGIDMDGDSDLDVVATMRSNSVIWLENNGTGSLLKHEIVSFLDSPRGLHSIDFDADGDNDLLVVSISQDSLFWYQNDGIGTFSKKLIDVVSNSKLDWVKSIDFDQDGDFDVLVASSINGELYWYESGNDVFVKHLITSEIKFFSDIEIADLDGDNFMDVIVGGQNFYVFFNKSFIEFEKLRVDNKSWALNGLEIIDFDNDGDLDVLCVESKTGFGVSGEGYLCWIENAMNDFIKHRISNYGEIGQLLSGDLLITDFDGDGDLDVFAAERNIKWWDFGCFVNDKKIKEIELEVCYGTSAKIIVQGVRSGVPYKLIDLATSTVVDSAQSTDGGDLLLNTNQLTNDGKYIIIAGGTSCNKQLSDTVSVTVKSVPTVFAGEDFTICQGSSFILNATGANTYAWSDTIANGDERMLLNDSFFVVTGYNSNGCLGTDTISVSVLDVAKDSSSNELCFGEEFIYKGKTYHSDTTIVDTVQYTVMGCDSLISYIIVAVRPQLDTLINVSGDSLSVAVGYENYTWVTCPDFTSVSGAENSPIYSPKDSLDYAVIITNGKCVDTTACASLRLTSINDFSMSQQFISVFPNPTKNYIQITSKNANHSMNVRVLDVQGREVIGSMIITSENDIIQTEKLENWNYYLEVTSKYFNKLIPFTKL